MAGLADVEWLTTDPRWYHFDTINNLAIVGMILATPYSVLILRTTHSTVTKSRTQLSISLIMEHWPGLLEAWMQIICREVETSTAVVIWSGWIGRTNNTNTNTSNTKSVPYCTH